MVKGILLPAAFFLGGRTAFHPSLYQSIYNLANTNKLLLPPPILTKSTILHTQH